MCNYGFATCVSISIVEELQNLGFNIVTKLPI